MKIIDIYNFVTNKSLLLYNSIPYLGLDKFQFKIIRTKIILFKNDMYRFKRCLCGAPKLFLSSFNYIFKICGSNTLHICIIYPINYN